jgi:hypothetical protein
LSTYSCQKGLIIQEGELVVGKDYSGKDVGTGEGGKR